MNSFLKQMESKFIELDNEEQIEETEIEEQNTTAAVAGFNTPAAFAKPGKWRGKKAQYESVNKPASWTMGAYQAPEDAEEEYTDKFPFADQDGMWQHKNYKYPSVDLTGTPGTATKKDKTKHVKLTTEDVLEKKYEELIESYRRFATEDKNLSPDRKVKNTIKEIAKKLQEIETMVSYNTRLKTESGVAASTYGPGTQKALTKISERLIKISERVRALGE